MRQSVLPGGRALRIEALTMAIGIALSVCGGSAALAASTLGTRIDALEAEIRARIGPAQCRTDADCRALPIGALACGGPSRFLPYSVVGTDERALARAAAEHRRLSAEKVRAEGTMGACVMLTPPVPRCEPSRSVCAF